MATVLDVFSNTFGSVLTAAQTSVASIGVAASDKARQTVTNAIESIGPKNNTAVDSVASGIKPSVSATPTTTLLNGIIGGSLSPNVLLAMVGAGLLLLFVIRRNR